MVVGEEEGQGSREGSEERVWSQTPHSQAAAVFLVS